MPGRAMGALRWVVSACVVLLAFAVTTAAQAGVVVEIWQAQRTIDGHSETVRLPDSVELPDRAAGPLHATYRMSFNLPHEPQRLAICAPGLIANARILFNGHIVSDRLGRPFDPLPRSLDRIRLIEVAQEFVQRGENVIEIEATGAEYVSISSLNVGEPSALGRRYERRILGSVVGPAFVAVVVASLALCVLLLWARSGDSLYGYFGLGTLAWALHDAWSVSPAPILGTDARFIWWTSLYSFFVAMLVIFCVRFAGWKWPRFDRAIGLLALSGPVVMATAVADNKQAIVQGWWLLLWIGIVSIGFVAVGRYAWRRRNASGVLLFLTGAISLVFSVRDWLVSHAGNDNNPIYLVPYAGLLFVVLVAWMLIDRFVATSREIETINRELEQRVSASSAQLVRALEQMRSSKELAESANRSKSTFLAAASHDLRQPIHALGLYMAALIDDRLSGEQRDVVQRMRTSLSALQSMFNALLDVSRMDAGTIAKRPRAFAPGPLLHRLAEECAPIAADKKLRLSVRIAPVPAGVHAVSDPILIERIVLNLLGNALKYTDSGGVLVSARLRSGASGHWRIEVWDTGRGIAAADLERIFDEFYQVGNPERDRTQGLGLGLSIVRRLTELLGHRLEVISTVGRGTRFAIELPVTTDAVAKVAAEAVVESLGALHVAIIDDDPEVRESTRFLLERWGCTVYASADACGVLEHLSKSASGALHAIVADYRLRGELTGLEVVRTLRAAFGDRLPALIVSGESSPDHLARMRTSGFDFISKPVAPARLRGWLARIARDRMPAPAEALHS
jgi:signal transduction histidine kinase